MMTALFSYLAVSSVCIVAAIAIGWRLKKNKLRQIKMDEALVEAALEGAMIRELSDHGFLRTGK